MKSICTLALTALAVLCPPFTNAATPITIESLLLEMTDRQQLARYPMPSYLCLQSSSYDRDAVSPDEQETWYANWDRSQFVRIEEKNGRKEYVMHDAAGPGAIVRIWATWHGPRGEPFSNGTIRIYFDGEETPRIEGPIADILDKGGLAGPPLSQGVSPSTNYGQRGHNLYLPIPYAKHCKITYSTDVPVDRGGRNGEALYYQINYRTYAEGTDVETFSAEQLTAEQPLVNETNRKLREAQRDVQGDWSKLKTDGEIASGESSEPIRIEGAGAIRSLSLRLNADDLEQALRSTVLEMRFDGDRTVWCPVGEFFGSGYKLCPHKTWYTEVDDDGTLSCAWVMPFEQGAELVLHNLGDQLVDLSEGIVSYSDWNWDKRSMHFHATWRQLTEIDTQGGKNMDGSGAFDVNYVTIEGKGVYVGDTLTVLNGTAKWWGEGDEKIYIDGEDFPSHFGTGTEDYYGYAWCRPEFFSAPFHAQLEGGGNLAGGYSVNSRYRSLDAIPFTGALQVDMELWHWAGTKVNYAPVTFWYGMPGVECNVQPDPATATLPVARVKSDISPVMRVPGAIEGESMKVAHRSGGAVEVQSAEFGWSEGAQLWWRDGEKGDMLVLEFPVEEGGRYQIGANLTKAVDYAVVQISVNDSDGVEFDRFNSKVEHDLVELGVFDLASGTNRLELEIKGTNRQAEPRRMVGIDYLLLTPAKADE